MRLDSGSTRAASPVLLPESTLPRRSRGPVVFGLGILGLVALLTATPAAAIGTPTLLVEPAECDLLGATDVSVTAFGIGEGTYRVGVASAGLPVEGVEPQPVTAASASVTFADLPNGATYEVWLEGPDAFVVATQAAALPVCDLPTLDAPSESENTGGAPGDAAAPVTASSEALPPTGGAGGAPTSTLVATAAAIQLTALAAGVLVLRSRGRGTHRA